MISHFSRAWQGALKATAVAFLACSLPTFAQTKPQTKVPTEEKADARSLVQTLLKRGMPLKAVAPAVGHTSPVALTRVFTRRLGLSAAQWLAK